MDDDRRIHGMLSHNADVLQVWELHLEMKKPNQKINSKKSPKKENTVSIKNSEAADGVTKPRRQGQSVSEKVPRVVQKAPKKSPEAGPGAVGKAAGKIRRFLREAKVELKKVKWPTRKELLASTAVVIVLTLLVAFYLGLVDFGLIKIIRNVVR